MKTKKVSGQSSVVSCPTGHDATREELGRVVHRSFHDLFIAARKSPTYWLYGLEIKIEETIIRYRRWQKLAPTLNLRLEFEHKILALGWCKKLVRSEQRRFEALPENRAPKRHGIKRITKS